MPIPSFFVSRMGHYLRRRWAAKRRRREVAGTMESFVRPNNARYRRILYPTIGSRIAASRYNNTADHFRYCYEEKAAGLSDDLARFLRRKRSELAFMRKNIAYRRRFESARTIDLIATNAAFLRGSDMIRIINACA